MGARARTVRVRPSWSVCQRARRAQIGGMEVSAERHKSDCRRLHGRRGPTRPSTLRLRRAAFDAVMPCRLWLLGWRDADASLCSGLLAAMPRRLGRRLERNSAGRCHCCAPGCRSALRATPSLAWHVVIYNDREYIPVIKCIGYK